MLWQLLCKLYPTTSAPLFTSSFRKLCFKGVDLLIADIQQAQDNGLLTNSINDNVSHLGLFVNSIWNAAKDQFAFHDGEKLKLLIIGVLKEGLLYYGSSFRGALCFILQNSLPVV